MMWRQRGHRDTNETENPEVFRTFDDGYVVRAMTASDAAIVQRWYAGMGTISRYDLDVALRAFPAGRGFYVGVYDDRVVASCVRLPWGNDVFYGSYYYVHEDYRCNGYGTRLRDQVAYGHVLEANGKLAVDAVQGSVAEKNASKFGYEAAFVTRRYAGIAKDFATTHSVVIVKANSTPFDELISFDNKHFVSRDYPVRRKFLKEWINIPDGAAVVALNDRGQIVGFGQRRPAVAPQSHLIGPLYADDTETAMAVLQDLCRDVIGESITLNIWMLNEEGVAAIEGLGFQKVFDVLRMHANGNPNEYKPTVYALTSLDTCGF